MGINELRACRYWGEREGRAALALWKRSSEPLAVFARRIGIERSRLAYWAQRTGDARSVTPAFAPVAILAAAGARGVLSVELRSGRVIRIEGEFDDALLERVIVIAERAGC